MFAETLKAFDARVDPVSGRYAGPDEKTVRGLCARLDGDAVDVAVSRWLQCRVRAAARARGRTGRKARRRAKAAGQRRRRASTRDRYRPRFAQVAVDGKTSRGAKTAGRAAPHLLAALSCTGVVLAQRQIADKSNEIGAFVALLTPLELAETSPPCSTGSTLWTGRACRSPRGVSTTTGAGTSCAPSRSCPPRPS